MLIFQLKTCVIDTFQCVQSSGNSAELKKRLCEIYNDYVLKISDYNDHRLKSLPQSSSFEIK